MGVIAAILRPHRPATRRRPGAEVPRALRRDPRRHRGQGLWDETDGLFYDRLAAPDGDGRCRSRSARWSASSRCWPRAWSTRSCSTARRRSGKQLRRVPGPGGPARPRAAASSSGLLRGEPGTPAAAARRRRHRPARAAVREAVRRGRVPLPLRPARAVGLPPRAPVRARRAGVHARRSTTSPPSRPPRCSAATPTGAGRCGSRSTTWSIAALERYHRFFGDDYTVEYPTGSGRPAAAGRDRRGPAGPADRRSSWSGRTGGGRASAGSSGCSTTRAWKDNMVFNEYFHGDNGAGLGASHQTGWTGLVADLIRRRHGEVTSHRRPAAGPAATRTGPSR